MGILKEYPHLKHVEKELDCVVSGSLESIIAIRDVINERIAQEAAALITTPTLYPTTEAAAASLHVQPKSPSSSMSVYGDFSPDALALLEKLPEGSIDGVHYDWMTGRVFIDQEPPSKEEERISKFQDAYQGIVSTRKLKVECISVPVVVASDELDNLTIRYNATYNQCVFIRQEEPDRQVKIISTSSRQIDQAKKLFADELEKGATDAAAASTSSMEMMLLSDGRKLTLKRADIVKEDVDIIVNPANDCLRHGGGVAGALNEASNGKLQKYSDHYVQSKGRVSVGRIATTPGGGELKCKHVIHAVGPVKSCGATKCEQLLDQVVKESLRCAERYNAISIAIPAISSGIFGVSKELVARCVVDAIMMFNYTKTPPCLSDIRIVILDRPSYTPFARHIQEKKKMLHKPTKSTHSNLIQPAKLLLPQKSPANSPTASPLPSSEEGQSEAASSTVGSAPSLQSHGI